MHYILSVADLSNKEFNQSTDVIPALVILNRGDSRLGCAVLAQNYIFLGRIWIFDQKFDFFVNRNFDEIFFDVKDSVFIEILLAMGKAKQRKTPFVTKVKFVFLRKFQVLTKNSIIVNF